MNIQHRHEWPINQEEAIAIQQQLAKEVILSDRLETVEYVAGVDVGYENNEITRAAVVVLSFPDLQFVEQAIATLPTTFPYIPGFLSFREVPAILDALAKLHTIPNLILCDGQGIAHPRRFGIACHIGILADVPTIGVAKSWLIGKYEKVAETRGSWQLMLDKGETIGAVLRTRNNVKPLYISSGHRISLPTAIDYVMSCTTKYRLPETTRWADKLASNR